MEKGYYAPIILLNILPIVLFSSFIEHQGLQVHLPSEVQYGPLLDTHESASVKKKRNEGCPESSNIVLKRGMFLGSYISFYSLYLIEVLNNQSSFCELLSV